MQRKYKSGAVGRIVQRGDGPAMGCYNGTAQAQPQPQTAAAIPTGIVGGVEHIEQLFPSLGGDAGAVVGDPHLYPRTLAFG